jgi:YD repeat-containing protein
MTSYTYDAVNRLIGVNQSGQTRSFTYDGLGRLLTSTTPESGTLTNVYDTGSAGDLFTSTFSAPNVSSGTVTACYGNWSNGACTGNSWDGMHRPTYISFSDGSNPYGYTYDSSNIWGTSLNSTKGRLVLANHANVAASWFSYDKMGRAANVYSCTPINCGTSHWTFTYNYDYIGDVTSFTDATGITYTNTLDSIGPSNFGIPEFALRISTWHFMD